jgi:hypothetical protein
MRAVSPVSFFGLKRLKSVKGTFHVGGDILAPNMMRVREVPSGAQALLNNFRGNLSGRGL